jgi:glutamyl-tRNA synthetase
VVTWAIARNAGWGLVLRIEDLDTPRVKAGAVEGLISTLRWSGIDWDDGEILIQSQNLEPYREAMRRLAEAGRVYPCALTRAQIEAAASAPQADSGGSPHEVVFPARLRPPLRPLDFDRVQAEAGPEGTNWRFAVSPGQVGLVDSFAGSRSFDVSSIVGDFVVWTKRGQPSYQLAVVVDDHRQGVTQVVRGDDLLDSAARQLMLYRALGLAPEPAYTHLPLVLGPDGRRLAKRHGDTRVDSYRERGVPPEAVIGLMAWWSGAAPERRLMPASEFRERFSLATLPPGPVTFTAEDDRWLLAQAC